MTVEHDVIEACKKWVYGYVIDLNLCPFAKAPMDLGQIEWLIENNPYQFDQHIRQFYKSKSKSKMLVIPEAVSFMDYLNYVEVTAHVIRQLGYHEEIKIVTFHPEHIYEGIPESEAVVYANRSPYPIIQLLRKSDLRELGMTEKWKTEILRKNEETLEEIGSNKLNKKINEFRKEN